MFSIESYHKQVMQNECCGQKNHQIIQIMMLSQGLVLKLQFKSVVKDFYIRSAFFIIEESPKGEKSI